jgi:hypothetical protein
MGKIILTETQYKRFKSILIENTINQTLLNENDELSYTVQSEKVDFETGGGLDFELRIFKGAKFLPTSNGNLYANTKFQFVTTDTGEPNSDGTIRGNVYYHCKKGVFSAPRGGSISSAKAYYAEDPPAPALKKELDNLCTRVKNPKTSYGAESVGGGKSYTQQNDYILTSDSGKTIKIPKGTGYAYKEGKQGASFKLPGNKFGWFGCPSKIFLVDNVKYKDAKGYLANNIVKAICGGEPKKDEQQQYQQQYRSSGTKQVVGQGGGGSSDYSEYV